MREIRTSGLMSGEGRRSCLRRSPRPSSTLPADRRGRRFGGQNGRDDQARRFRFEIEGSRRIPGGRSQLLGRPALLSAERSEGGGALQVQISEVVLGLERAG